MTCSTPPGCRSHWSLNDEQVAGTPSTAGATDLVVQDGAWHMLTLTTLTPLQPGFQLFVDGALATYIDSQSIYISALLRSTACI